MCKGYNYFRRWRVQQSVITEENTYQDCMIWIRYTMNLLSAFYSDHHVWAFSVHYSQISYYIVVRNGQLLSVRTVGNSVLTYCIIHYTWTSSNTLILAEQLTYLQVWHYGILLTFKRAIWHFSVCSCARQTDRLLLFTVYRALSTGNMLILCCEWQHDVSHWWRLYWYV